MRLREPSLNACSYSPYKLASGVIFPNSLIRPLVYALSTIAGASFGFDNKVEGEASKPVPLKPQPGNELLEVDCVLTVLRAPPEPLIKCSLTELTPTSTLNVSFSLMVAVTPAASRLAPLVKLPDLSFVCNAFAPSSTAGLSW